MVRQLLLAALIAGTAGTAAASRRAAARRACLSARVPAQAGRGEQETPTPCRTRPSPTCSTPTPSSQAQRELTIADEKYGTFAARLKKLQDMRRRNQRQRQHARARALPNGGAESARPGRRDGHPQPAHGASGARRSGRGRAAAGLRRARRSPRYAAAGAVSDVRGADRAAQAGPPRPRAGARAAETAAAVSRPAAAGRHSSHDGPFRLESVYNCPMALRLRSVVLVGLSLAVVALVCRSAAQPRRDQAGRRSLPGQARSHHGLRQRAQGARVTANAASASQTTQLTDAELNSYLHFHLKDQVPAGVVDPTLERARRRTRARRRDDRSRCGPQAEAARLDRSDELHDRPAAR